MARPLTDEETLVLRAYQRQVNRLRQSSLFRTEKVAFRFSTKISFPTGEIDTTYEGYDKEAFQAQLPILRQFFLDQDSINFSRIHNLVNMCCDRQELVEWTRYTRRKWVEILARMPLGDSLFLPNETPNVEDAVEKLFYGYGGLFHVDIHQPDEEENVRKLREATLQSVFPYFWNCLQNLNGVINLWLDEPSRPVPPLPDELSKK